MHKFYRLALALFVFVSGVALVPMIGLPDVGFSWQRFANIYQPATLEINHNTGQPGSFFTVTGFSFSPNVTVAVTANGTSLGNVQTNSNGDLLFIIDSTGAELGLYVVVAAAGESASVRFTLVESGDLWPQDAEGPVLLLPPDIAGSPIYLPVSTR